MIVSILIFHVLLPLFFVLRLWKGSHDLPVPVRLAPPAPGGRRRVVAPGAVPAAACAATPGGVLPDQSPPARDEEKVAGNYVALECGGAAVLLAHLRNGSLRVGTGDKVATGQPLGQVGNSGNTSEPHLHIHVERTPYGGERSTRPGVPMRFDGRSLIRNSVVFSRP